MPATVAAVAAAAPEKNTATSGRMSEVPQGTQPRPMAAATEAKPLSPTCLVTDCSLRLFFLAVKMTTVIDSPWRSDTTRSNAPFSELKPCLNISMNMVPRRETLSNIGSRDIISGP